MPLFDKLLVLDVDNTLLYSTVKPLGHLPDLQCVGYNVYKRPYVDMFLSICASWYTLGIWTAGSPGYLRNIVPGVIPAPWQFQYARDRCSAKPMPDGYTYLIKRLSKVRKFGWQLGQVLVVDDAHQTYMENRRNGVPISRFTGDPADRALLDLLPYLWQWGAATDVRKVTKTCWQGNAIKEEVA